MKKFLAVPVVCALLFFASCPLPQISDPTAADDPSPTNIEDGFGAVSLTIRENIAPRSILPLPTDRTVANFHISATGPGEEATADTASSTVVLNDLEPGEWTVTVTGYNAAAVAIYTGSQSVTVASGVESPVTIVLVPVAGTGSIAFDLSWPASVTSPTVQAQIKPFGEPDTAFSALALEPIVGDSVSYPTTPYATGSYVVRISLSSEGVAVASVVLAAVVFPGYTSTQSYALQSWEISTGPPAPTNPAATALSDTEIQISWDDNAITEEGFTIERSPDGTTNWTQVISGLAPNTLSHTDSGLAPDTEYWYRVTAYNDFPPAGVSSTAQAVTRLRWDAVVTDPALLSVLGSSGTVYCDEIVMIDAKSAGVTSLAGVGRFSNMSSLDVSGNTITDLSPLSGLTGLTSLDASDNALTDTAALSTLSGLVSLTMERCGIADFSAISGLTGLETLWVRENPFTDLTAFSGLSSLVVLDAADCAFNDVTPLSVLTALITLDLSANDITTGILSLTTLTAATSMNLTGNLNLAAADVDALRTALPGCSIAWSAPGSADIGIDVPAEPSVELMGWNPTMGSTDSMPVTANVNVTASYYYWYIDGVLVDHGAGAWGYTVTTSGAPWGKRYHLDVVVLTAYGAAHDGVVYQITD